MYRCGGVISPLLNLKLYIDDYLKKKTTILANAEKGKDINIDIFMPKVTEVTSGKTNKECFPTTIEEYDMYIEMLCENCLTEILNKKITAIKPKKIE